MLPVAETSQISSGASDYGRDAVDLAGGLHL